jgi:flagellar protein FliO/FliZ
MTLRPAFLSAASAALGCLLLAPAALAAGGESTPLHLGGAAAAGASGASSSSSTGTGMVRTIVGLAVVLGVIFGLHWILKNAKAARERKATGRGLEPLASLPLGGNRSLALVRAGNDVLLVGVGDGSVTPIRRYAEEEARSLGLLADDEPEVEEARPAAARPSFAGLIDGLRARTVIR